jgi:hypothetical protein
VARRLALLAISIACLAYFAVRTATGSFDLWALIALVLLAAIGLGLSLRHRGTR